MLKITVNVNGQEQEFELDDETLSVLTRLAKRNKLSIEQMLVQAIVNEQFIEDRLEKDDRVVIGRSDRSRLAPA